MATSDALTELQDWYARQCDGDWDHTFGVTIETLDNPGWQVRVDLHGTALAGKPFDRVEMNRSDADWLVCSIEGEQFRAACGTHNLAEALDAFIRWAG